VNLTGKSALIALGAFVRRFSTVLVSIALVRLLTKGDVGTYRQTLLVTTTLYAVLVFGVPASVYFFVSALEKQRHRFFLTQTLVILGILALAGSLFCGFGAQWLAARLRNPQLVSTLVAAVPFLFFHIISSVIFPALISYQRYRVAVALGVGFEFLRSATVIAALALGANLASAFLLLGAISAVEFAVGLGLVRASAGGIGWPPTRQEVQRQLGYAVPLGTSAAVGTLREQIDKLVISVFFSPAAFAVYSMGAVNLPLISIVQSSVFPVMLTELVTRMKRDGASAAFPLWRAAVRKMSLVLFPACIFSLIFASHLMVVLYTGAYSNAAIPFRIYLLVILLRVPPVSPVILAFGRSGLILWTTLLGLAVNIACSLALVQRVGFWGPPLAALISVVVILTIYYVRCGKDMSIGTLRVLCLPEQGRAMAAALAAGLGSGWLLWLPLSSLATLATGFALYCVLYAVICWKTGIVTPTEKRQLRSFVRPFSSPSA